MSPIRKPPFHAPHPKDAGFSLVEIMVVLAFIAVGILALVGVQTRSFNDVYSTGRQTRAIDLAQMRMEVARGAGYTLVQTDSGLVTPYNWRTQVDSADVALKRLTVTVTWSESGSPRSLQLVNLMSAR